MASITGCTAATAVAASSSGASAETCGTRASARGAVWWTRRGGTGARTAASRSASPST